MRAAQTLTRTLGNFPRLPPTAAPRLRLSCRERCSSGGFASSATGRPLHSVPRRLAAITHWSSGTSLPPGSPSSRPPPPSAACWLPLSLCLTLSLSLSLPLLSQHNESLCFAVSPRSGSRCQKSARNRPERERKIQATFFFFPPTPSIKRSITRDRATLPMGVKTL